MRLVQAGMIVLPDGTAAPGVVIVGTPEDVERLAPLLGEQVTVEPELPRGGFKTLYMTPPTKER